MIKGRAAADGAAAGAAAGGSNNEACADGEAGAVRGAGSWSTTRLGQEVTLQRLEHLELPVVSAVQRSAVRIYSGSGDEGEGTIP